MGNQNRKATKEEMAHARRVIARHSQSLPLCLALIVTTAVIAHHDDHTIAFRLQDERGKFRSNVVWLMPDWLATLTVGNIRALVAESNGKRK